MLEVPGTGKSLGIVGAARPARPVTASRSVARPLDEEDYPRPSAGPNTTGHPDAIGRKPAPANSPQASNRATNAGRTWVPAFSIHLLIREQSLGAERSTRRTDVTRSARGYGDSHSSPALSQLHSDRPTVQADAPSSGSFDSSGRSQRPFASSLLSTVAHSGRRANRTRQIPKSERGSSHSVRCKQGYGRRVEVHDDPACSHADIAPFARIVR